MVAFPSTPEKGGALPSGLTSSHWSSIRQAYEAGRHAVSKQENGFLTAHNPGQEWESRFDGRGFTIKPHHARWVWGFDLQSYGLDGSPHKLPERARVVHEKERVVYHWNDALEEWFINDSRGLEQGWTLHERPVGANPNRPLVLDLKVRGNLKPQVTADGRGIRFHHASGVAALTYDGLKAWDANGTPLKVQFSSLGNGIRVAVNEQQARYPITIDPLAQQAYLKASNTAVDDRFGVSVGVSGDTVVVGAIWEDSNATGVNGDQSNNSSPNSGAAYVFVRNGSTWTQQAYLKASNPGSDDSFGQAVAISGDTIVVGVEKEDSLSTGVNGAQNNENGTDAGAVYVFRRNGTTWSQEAYLKASNTDPGDQFGHSVAIDGNTIIVGANYERSSFNGVNTVQSDDSAANAGAAYIFTRTGSTWSQQAYLKAFNTGAEDRFGESVSISGDTAVVGAWFESSSSTGVNGSGLNNLSSQSGAAYIFSRDNSIWTQEAYLKAHNTGMDDLFGYSVAISGQTVVVGAFGEDGSGTGVNPANNNDATDAGAAYVFSGGGGSWSQVAYLKAGNTQANDRFGWSVAVSGPVLAVGALWEDGQGSGFNPPSDDIFGVGYNTGAAYVFRDNGSSWSQLAYLKHSSPSSSDGFSYALSLSGNTLVASSPYESSNSTGVNGDSSNNNALASGAAHVYVLFPIDDQDNDGVVDTWETANGFNPAVTGDVPTLDSDNDGLTDITEIFQGTNRNLASSRYGLQNTAVEIDGSTRILTSRYRRSTTQSAVTGTQQWTDSLDSPFTSASTRGGVTVTFEEEIMESGGDYQIVEVTANVTAGSPSHLFLKFDLQPQD
jgi:trimeric autotransporter adhesin